LDDSDDETLDLVDIEISNYRKLGFIIHPIRRANRIGFKAGSLQNAIAHSNGEFIVIFDADCTPSEDFLETTIPLFESNTELGFIQTCLVYHNRSFNELTEAFALALDFHYHLELPGRQNLSLISTFNGSAGVIRKEALLDIGGWRWYSMTEDADLSARMATNGWKSRYISEVVVGSDVPYTLDDFINQQSRWAMGGIQAAPKLIKQIWKSKYHKIPQKFEATLHLTYYLIFPVMTISSILLVSLIFFGLDPTPIYYSLLGLLSLLGSLGVFLSYTSSLKYAGQNIINKTPYLLLLGVIGIGVAPRLSVMLVRSLLSKKREFVVTPTYNLDFKLNPTNIVFKKYTKSGYIEMIFIIITIIGIIYSFINRTYIVI
jgi:cellulose synthase/poly-beta-1,6-N-acetylglucosamine synthase-like glycosyltransferase